MTNILLMTIMPLSTGLRDERSMLNDNSEEQMIPDVPALSMLRRARMSDQ
jgi:hypothetical protein